MRRTNLELKLYLHLLIITGVVFVVIATLNFNLYKLNWPDISFFGILIFLFLAKPVKLSKDTIYYLDDIPCYAAIFLIGVKATILMLVLSFMVYLIYNRIQTKTKKQNLINLYLSLVNLSQIIISTGIAGLAYQLINQQALFLSSLRNLTAISVCVLVKFTINTLETSFGLFLKNYQKSFIDVWKENFSGVWVHFLMLAPMGIVLAELYKSKSWAVIIIVIPVAAFYTSFYVYRKIIQQSQRTFQALTKIIDARDHSTFGHSERVGALAKAIAEEMKLDKKTVHLAEQAGKIHDLGKIIINDNILKKKKPLTAEEAALMKSHSAITHNFFKNMEDLKKYIPVEIASYHHERYDGTGYYLGLKGEEIPLVARILAVADVYDAMTSDRSYREKLSEEESLKQIKESSGSQFDTAVVEAFLRVYDGEFHKKIKKDWEKKELIYNKIQKAGEIESKYS